MVGVLVLLAVLPLAIEQAELVVLEVVLLT
jgi:hypothetical protein